MTFRVLLFSLAALALTIPFPARAQEPVLHSRDLYSWERPSGDLTGNPRVSYIGDLTESDQIRTRFTDTATWIVSSDLDNDGRDEAVILFDDGTLRFVSYSGNRARTMATARKMSPESAPVILRELDGEAYNGVALVDEGGDLVAVSMDGGRTTRLAGGFSTLTYPVVADLNRDGSVEIAAVGDEGELKIVRGRNSDRSEDKTRLLPDTRLVAADLDNNGTLEVVALTRPKKIEELGILGDDLEAGGVGVFSWDGSSVSLEQELTLDDEEVFEAVRAFVAKGIDGDRDLIVLPVFKSGEGVSLRSFSYRTTDIRQERKSTGFEEAKTLQVLGLSSLGDRGMKYLLTVRDPLSDEPGLWLFRDDLVGSPLTHDGDISTFLPATRNGETVIIADFDGDGQDELLAPGDERKSLRLFFLRGSRIGWKEVYRGTREIRSNPCPGDFNGDGWPDVAVGLENGAVLFLMGR